MASPASIGKILRCFDEENKFYWELPNYFAYQSDSLSESASCVIQSPCFSYFGSQWRLALIKQGLVNASKYVGLFLWESSYTNRLQNIKVKLGLVSIKKNNIHKQCEGQVDDSFSFGSWKFLNLYFFWHLREELSPNGRLKFFCIFQGGSEIGCSAPQITLDAENDSDGEKNKDNENISDQASTDEDNEEESVTSETRGLDRLVQNLKNLLLDEQSSDVVLKIDDREFKVHKVILKMRSPVFASMFQPDSKESITGIVDIPDCSAPAFEIFLSYVYTGSADTISAENVFDVYYVADKYQFDDLKLDCVDFMEKNISAENFCKVMTLSLMHSESRLQKTATRFFCDNVKEIIKTVDWQKYLKEHSTEANELLIKVFNA